MTISFSVSVTDVASEALGQLGRAPIHDLEDPSDPVAVQAKQYFGSLLRTMLRDHTWNFAKTRIELAQNITAPISRWSFAYTLPGDCFRAVRVNDELIGSTTANGPPVWPFVNFPRWEIEGRNLLTNESRVILEYIKWAIDPNEWDGGFHQAFVTMLAVRLCTALDTDKEKANDLWKLYQLQIMDAKAVDGQEQSLDSMSCTTLTDDIRE